MIAKKSIPQYLIFIVILCNKDEITHAWTFTALDSWNGWLIIPVG
jgi:hypothetical protein